MGVGVLLFRRPKFRERGFWNDPPVGSIPAISFVCGLKHDAHTHAHTHTHTHTRTHTHTHTNLLVGSSKAVACFLVFRLAGIGLRMRVSFIIIFFWLASACE